MLDQEKGVKMPKIELSKQWQKPVLTTINSAELKSYIQAAARSGSCFRNTR